MTAQWLLGVCVFQQAVVKMKDCSCSRKDHVTHCIGFAWQGFGSGAATGVASVRRCQKLPLHLIKPMPAGSKTDPLLAKAEPISDRGSASGITYLRKGKEVMGRSNCSWREE